MKRSILIATPIFPPDIGGPASSVPKIADALLAKGAQVSVLTYSDSAKSGLHYQYSVERVTRGSFAIFRYIKYFKRLLALGSNVDVIFIQDPLSTGLPAVFANIFLKKKLIIKVVGDAAWERAVNKGLYTKTLDEFVHDRDLSTGFVKRVKRLQSFVIKKCDAIIVPSVYLKGIVSHYTSGKQHSTVIYNSFDVIEYAHIDREKEKAQRRWNGKRIILTVARLVAWKNIDSLIKSMTDLDEDTILAIVGSGPLKTQYESLAREHAVSGRVHFVGNVDKDELYKIYQMADVFALISTYEGMSHTLLEAMYMGLPVVVSSFGGNPETVEKYKQAYMVSDPSDQKQVVDQIKHALTIPHDESVRKSVEKRFSYDTMIDKTLSILLDGEKQQ